MADGRQREFETTNLRSYLVSGLYSLIGLAGLYGTYYLAHAKAEKPWWIPAVENGFSIVAGTGFIGILFELSLRRNLITETVLRLRTLFDEDPDFAKSLSVTAREQRVENTLKAHLEPELGHAIFLGLVHRYFAQPNRYRKDARLLVALSSCSELKINAFLPPKAPLDVTKYCSLVADYSFRLKVKRSRTTFVICTLSDNIGDLYEIFRKDDCIAREIIQLDDKDRTSILEAFKNTKKDHWGLIIQSIAQVQLSVNGAKLPLLSTQFIEKSLSLVFEFDSTDLRENPDLDRYQVIIKSVYLRSYGVFPVVIAEPTYNPYMELSYSDPRLARVSAAPFLTCEMPFEPRITIDCDLRRIAIDTADKNGEPAWVFPSSGVLFTWQAN